MNHRTAFALASASTIVAVGLGVAAPADAASSCVTRNAYSAVHVGATIADVQSYYGMPGRVVYVGTTNTVIGDSPNGGTPHQAITTSHTVMTFRKCRSFDHGLGRVAYDFTSSDGSTAAAAERARVDYRDLSVFGAF